MGEVTYITSAKKRGRPAKLKRRERGAIGRPRNEAAIPTVPVAVTPVFVKTREHDDKLVLIERGGARSSKSHSISQKKIERLFAYPDTGRKILILRKTMPALRISTMPLITSIIKGYGLWDRVQEDKRLNNLNYGKSFIHFGSLDDPEKIKSTGWNDIYMEEATEFTYEDFMVLKLRLSEPVSRGPRNQITLVFNPTDEFSWIKTKLMHSERDIAEIHSTYKDNPFLPDEYVRSLESVKEQDPNYWRIFGEGEWGKLENLIYTNWYLAPQHLTQGETIYGLDFGFNNETCLAKFVFDGFEVTAETLIYESGLTNNKLIERMEQIFPKETRAEFQIYPDCAEPARIAELDEAGFWVTPADKNVKDGIDFVKRYHIGIVQWSEPAKKEIQAYSWRQDKNNKVLDEPVKFNDHFVDSMRYALYTHNKGRGDLAVRWL